MKYAPIALAIIVMATVSPRAQNAKPQAFAAEKPKLVVLISVDQMRGDYVDKFRHQWTRGLHRLISEGAWFRQADYPYYTTVTCAGHASISTGTVV
jgi:predicted AlkP superfamily pyrophosphatase or phosphodiesterase